MGSIHQFELKMGYFLLFCGKMGHFEAVLGYITCIYAGISQNSWDGNSVWQQQGLKKIVTNKAIFQHEKQAADQEITSKQRVPNRKRINRSTPPHLQKNCSSGYSPRSKIKSFVKVVLWL